MESKDASAKGRDTQALNPPVQRAMVHVGRGHVEVQETSLAHARAVFASLVHACAGGELVFRIREGEDFFAAGALLLSPAKLEAIVNAQVRIAMDEARAAGSIEHLGARVSPNPARLRAILEWRGIRKVMNGTQWMTAREIGRHLESKAAKPWLRLGQWERRGQIFSIPDGEKKYPRYLFDERWRPLAGTRAILSVFVGRTEYEIAAWFESTSRMLRGERPREVLARDPSAVLLAAQDHVFGAIFG